jgi:surfactin synthase thioesterase subunit
MRGPLTALFAFDFPGHGARRERAFARSTKTMAKTTTKTV